MPRLDEMYPTELTWEHDPDSIVFELVERKAVAIVRFNRYTAKPFAWRVGDHAGGGCATLGEAVSIALDVYRNGDPDGRYSPTPFDDGDGGDSE